MPRMCVDTWNEVKEKKDGIRSVQRERAGIGTPPFPCPILAVKFPKHPSINPSQGDRVLSRPGVLPLVFTVVIIGALLGGFCLVLAIDIIAIRNYPGWQRTGC